MTPFEKGPIYQGLTRQTYIRGRHSAHFLPRQKATFLIIPFQ